MRISLFPASSDTDAEKFFARSSYNLSQIFPRHRLPMPGEKVQWESVLEANFFAV